MRLLWATLMLLLVAAVSQAAFNQTQTVTMRLSQNDGADWEGQFCFELSQPILGYLVVVNFNAGIKDIKNWVGDWIKKEPCSNQWTLVNGDIHGLHQAGEFCVRLAGTLCSITDPSATATLIDLTGDGQVPPSPPNIEGAQAMKYNYGEVLQKSILFYEAQRSGKLPATNRVPWRGDSALQDRGDKGEDLTGGWYDAGDNVKFNFPMAWSTAVLCWSLLEFPQAYEKAGQLDYMYDSIRWPLEYFVKCHTAPNELYVQVGNGDQDHSVWTSPERMSSNRPAYKIDASKPGSDVADETAAAMACGSLAFRHTDPSFAATLITHAKQLYAFARSHQGFYSDSVSDAANFYKSYNYTDELIWAGAWMYRATGDVEYINDAEETYLPGPAWGFSWDEKNFGNQILLYNLTRKDKYRNDVISTMMGWSKGGGIDYTPKCLAWRLEWGSLRYAANAAAMALTAANMGVNADQYRQWAMCQIHYVLGDTGRSFVVGFGSNPPTRPHHRSSSCPLMPAPCSWEAQRFSAANPHTLYGGLVGGPGANDDYEDERENYVHNEVACDYNAGLQYSAAALLQLAVDQKLPSPSACGTC